MPIAYLSSASLLKVLRDTKKRRQKAARYPLLAFANPRYDEKLTSAVPEPESLAAIRHRVYHALRGNYLAPLPETEDEAKEIAQLLNAPPETHPLQLREAASRPTVFQFNQQQRLDDYQYVLFATHGILPGEVDHIAQSALALSYPNREGYGYLTMADVFSLKLNAKLVSLSACNTGRGELKRGEGVMGLTRTFMYAGTPMIAVTLWSVESWSAKTLNVGFFQHLKYFNKPATALRAIKLRMLRGDKGDKYQHPYYWAPFVVFGEEPIGQRVPEPQGLEYYQQALAMEREVGNQRGEARSLTQLGKVYLDLKQYQPALQSFQQALTIYHDLNDNRGIEENWFNLGDTYFELGQDQKGQEYYQRVKTLP